MNKKPMQSKEGFTITARRLNPPLYPRGNSKGFSVGLKNARCTWCGQRHYGYSYGPVRLDERTQLPMSYTSWTYGPGLTSSPLEDRYYFFQDDSTQYCTSCVYKMVVEYQEQLKQRAEAEEQYKKRQRFYETFFKGVE